MTSPLRDEAGWIRLLSTTWHRKDAEVGLGDDGCVIPPARYTLSTDVLVEGVDFRRDWAPPEALGYKAMAANLSDLAAMGAFPRFFLMTLGFPKGYPEAFVEGVLRGLQARSDRCGVELCGGDLTQTPEGLFVSLTVIGEQSRRPLLRSGGRPGDALYLSGSLGGPAEALRRFEAGARLEVFDPLAGPADPERALLDRFYRPPDQIPLGLFLADTGAASSCMDVSDGLARDLSRICEACACGAEIRADALPVDPLLSGLGEEERLQRALEGGEEQILLFTVPPEREQSLDGSGVELYRVGRLTEGEGRVLVMPDGRREPIGDAGYDHFAP